jgi:hypothetical protein
VNEVPVAQRPGRQGPRRPALDERRRDQRLHAIAQERRGDVVAIEVLAVAQAHVDPVAREVDRILFHAQVEPHAALRRGIVRQAGVQPTAGKGGRNADHQRRARRIVEDPRRDAGDPLERLADLAVDRKPRVTERDPVIVAEE